MANQPPGIPASQKTRNLILEKLGRERNEPWATDITDIRKGQNPSGIIFITKKGNVPCQIRENPSYGFLIFPSGAIRRFKK